MLFSRKGNEGAFDCPFFQNKNLSIIKMLEKGNKYISTSKIISCVEIKFSRGTYPLVPDESLQMNNSITSSLIFGMFLFNFIIQS